MYTYIYLETNMSQNPLQQYFRQPKIYVGLPSQGAYSKPGTLEGDVSNMPIYGMTGLDEILIKTPDALLTGESTVRVIQSCCPGVKDAWELSSIDLDLLLIAIRIATFGNSMTVEHKCSKCEADNEYDIELGTLIEHYSNCRFSNKVTVGDLVVKIQPVTYRQTNDFSIKNFKIQQLIVQANSIEDNEKRNDVLKEVFKQLGDLQYEVFVATIEAVEVNDMVVTDRNHISEWLNNADKDVFDALKAHSEINRTAWETPSFKTKCTHCETENSVTIDMDFSSFFVGA